MFFVTLASLATIASAGPIAISQRADDANNTPKTSLSTAFKLIVHVADPAQEFDPPITNLEVSAFHTGAGQNAVSVSASGEVFYQQFYSNYSHYTGPPRDMYSTLSMTSAGPIAFVGAPLAGHPFVSDLGLPATSPMNSTGFEVRGPWPQLYPDSMGMYPYQFNTFIACRQPEAATTQPEVAIRFIDMNDEDGKLADAMPEGCVVVNLFAQCAELAERPYTLPTWEEAPTEVMCYENVAEIDWSQYDYPPVHYEFIPEKH